MKPAFLGGYFVRLPSFSTSGDTSDLCPGTSSNRFESDPESTRSELRIYSRSFLLHRLVRRSLLWFILTCRRHSQPHNSWSPSLDTQLPSLSLRLRPRHPSVLLWLFIWSAMDPFVFRAPSELKPTVKLAPFLATRSYIPDVDVNWNGRDQK